MSEFLSAIRATLADRRLRTHVESRQVWHLADALPDPEQFWGLDDLEGAFARGGIPAGDVKLYLKNSGIDLATVGVADGPGLRPLALRSLARQGATIVANNLQRIFPALWDLACGAENWLDGPVSIGAIASFGHSGLKLHYDPQDLIIVQLAGAKKWHFYGEALRDTAGRREINDPPPETVPVTELMMRAGDVMYVPSGLRHRCEPQGMSLHIGIIVEHASGRDFVAHIAKVARKDPLLNEPVQRFLGREAIARQAEAMKTRLLELVAASDPQQWLDSHAASQAHVVDIEFVAPPPESPAARASLAATRQPVLNREGKWRSGEVLLDPLPGIGAVFDALRASDRSVGELRAEGLGDALDLLAEKGIVRIVP